MSLDEAMTVRDGLIFFLTLSAEIVIAVVVILAELRS
jgi:hypothetical protein